MLLICSITWFTKLIVRVWLKYCFESIQLRCRKKWHAGIVDSSVNSPSGSSPTAMFDTTMQLCSVRMLLKLYI
uniref:Uncharacterized protein n=1 Tax=Arundo donax TaxID=35708 RepID=A0A0A9H316_ARUDO